MSDWEESYLGGSPEAEARMIAKWTKQIHEIQDRLRDRSGAAVIQRAFHAKMVAGIADAEFRINAELPPHFQVGFFQPGAVYPAKVRFSNANGGIRSDARGDFRGIAIRVAIGNDGANGNGNGGGNGSGNGGIERATDLLCTNGAVSHARDARQFMVFARAAAGSRLLLLPRLLFKLGPFTTVRMLATLISGVERQVDSLATEQFWSRGPYRFGEQAVRFTVVPAEGTTADPVGNEPSANYLREELLQRLKQGPVSYDFKVQAFINKKKTPIENNAVEWDSPFEKIAELVIPQQDLTEAPNRAAEAAIDELEFNPWHTIPELRPLSSINRARKQVYQASAHFRAGRQAHFERGLIARIVVGIGNCFFSLVNRLGIPWHKFPVLMGTVNIGILREHLRERNLHDTEVRELVPKPDPTIKTTPYHVIKARQSDGSYNDLSDPKMGAAETRFARNMPLDRINPDPEGSLLEPNPREVALRLLRREEFIPATTLNLLAGAWIQFMVHGWFDHFRAKRPTGPNIDVPLNDNDEWPNERPMEVPRTMRDEPPTELVNRRHEILKEKDDYTNLDLLAYKNEFSQWWDNSQIYGYDAETTRRIRLTDPTQPGSGDVLPDGKIYVDESRQGKPLLAKDPEIDYRDFGDDSPPRDNDDEGIDLTGFNNNYWLGLSLLHTVFVLEHNAICDRLKAEYPNWGSDQLFETARLINIALIAKIHTVEWTPAIIANPSLRISMDTNWWGTVGQELQKLLPRQTDSELLDGIMGSPPEHQAAPFALTEEFATVYKLHPLVPDDYEFRSHADDAVLADGRLSFNKIQGKWTRGIRKKFLMSDLFYSFGTTHPGAVTLHNFPRELMAFQTLDQGPRDVATADIIRERERGVPRYNDFRELLRMPRIKSFDKMTANPKSAKLLEQMYGHVDKVDTMVGMFAETPPPGFGFSDTAFRIFVLMASRRLKSDRFFTTDWRPEVYTQAGLDWVRDNDMKTVLLRHFPELGPALMRVSNTFAPWNRIGSLKTRLITEAINMNDRPSVWYQRLTRRISYFGRRKS